MKKALTILLGVGLALGLYVGTVESQPTGWLSFLLQDPQGTVRFRALDRYGFPALLGQGTAVPTTANSGAPPVDGEVYVVTAASAEPDVRIYSTNSTAWYYLAQSNNGAGVDEANAVWFTTNAVTFEGATADNFELDVEPANVGQDTDMGIPDVGEADGSFLITTLDPGSGDIDDANAVWGASNQLIWEGATADAFETILQAQDADTADHTFQLPDNNAAADTYNLVFSVLDTNALDVANSIWLNSNQIIFEGATADDFETILVAQDADTADHTFQLPDNNVAADTYNLMFSTLDTNALQVASSIWFASASMVFEGATADDFEGTLTATDPTADRTWTLDDNGGTVSTWNVHREDFDHCLVESLEEDYTAAVVTDTSENIVRLNGSQIGMIHYRFEAPDGPGYAGTLEPCNDGAFDLDSFTDDVDNEGADFTVGSDPAGIGYMFDEEMSSTAYCEASFTIADVSEIDSFYFGFTTAEAYQDAGANNDHDTYAWVAIVDAAGDIQIETELNGGGTLADDVGTDFIDGATHVYRVEVLADSVNFWEDGTQLTQTNAVLNLDATDQVHCRFGYLNATGDATPDPDIVMNYLEYGLTQ